MALSIFIFVVRVQAAFVMAGVAGFLFVEIRRAVRRRRPARPRLSLAATPAGAPAP